MEYGKIAPLSNEERPYKCDICGKSFRLPQHLYIHGNTHLKKEKVPRTPPKEKITRTTAPVQYFDNDVEQRRKELEILRIENEIKRLKAPETPDSKIDYYDKMLQLQKEHNDTTLKFLQQNFETKLELEKLKIAGETITGNSTEEQLLLKLAEHLPAIMDAKSRENNPNIPKKEPKKQKKSNKEIEDYRKGIMSGEITEEMAYQDFCRDEPELSKIATREQFNARFKQIKAGEKV